MGARRRRCRKRRALRRRIFFARADARRTRRRFLGLRIFFGVVGGVRRSVGVAEMRGSKGAREGEKRKEMGSGKRETGNGKREVGNGKRETGNGKPGVVSVATTGSVRWAFGASGRGV